MTNPTLESAPSIGAMFRAQVTKYGARPFLKVKKGGMYRDLTWDDVDRAAMLTGRGLAKLGLQREERVAILSENRPEWVYTDLGALSIGATDVPIYATNTPEQVAYVVNDSGSKLLVCSDFHQMEKIREARPDMPNLETVIVMDPVTEHGGMPEGFISFEALLQMGEEYESPEWYQKQLGDVTGDMLATLIYTSGTTGDPKGVMLTHDNFLSNCRSLNKVAFVDDTDIGLSFLPLSHSFERMAGYYNAIYQGMTVAYAENMDTLLDNMAEIRPTVMASVPRFYEKVYGTVLSGVEEGSAIKKAIFNWSLKRGKAVSELRQAGKEPTGFLAMENGVAKALVFGKLQAKLGGRLKFFISGGAPLAREIAEFFHAAGITILEGYGLTETSPVLTMNRPDDYKFGTVGKPIPDVEIKIADDGEILARGPNIMQGYYNKPDATEEVIDEHRWFHTGDIGEFDRNGFLRITDRKKDIIVTSGGKNIAPQNIENLLKQQRYIEQACVIGDQHKYLVALIVPNFEELQKLPGHSSTACGDLVNEKEVLDAVQENIHTVNEQLARYETVKYFKLLPSEFTQENGMLTPTLKVRRKQVMEAYKSEIAEMYEDE